MSLLRDERGVIVDWLARTVLFLALFGITLFDGVSTAVNYLGLQGVADETAAAVSADLTGNTRPTEREIAEEAEALAQEHGARLLRAEMDSEGMVRIKMRRTAKTLFLGRIPATERWTRATAVGRFDTNSH
jgi:hypothetical protein